MIPSGERLLTVKSKVRTIGGMFIAGILVSPAPISIVILMVMLTVCLSSTLGWMRIAFRGSAPGSNNLTEELAAAVLVSPSDPAGARGADLLVSSVIFAVK